MQVRYEFKPLLTGGRYVFRKSMEELIAVRYNLWWYLSLFVPALVMIAGTFWHKQYFDILFFDQTGRFSGRRLCRLERSLNVFLDASKTFSVDGAAAEFPNGFSVGRGRIAFVFWKIELRIVVMVFLHQTVTSDFGDDRGCCNGNA